jgi:hypothetical protein
VSICEVIHESLESFSLRSFAVFKTSPECILFEVFHSSPHSRMKNTFLAGAGPHAARVFSAQYALFGGE